MTNDFLLSGGGRFVGGDTAGADGDYAVGCFALDLAVEEVHDAVGLLGNRRVVRDHDDRLAMLIDQLAESVGDALAV